MKNFALLGTLILLGALAFGCPSTPTPDVDHGVSNASYRGTIEIMTNNVAAQTSQLLAGQAKDAASTTPVHGADWWEVLIRANKVTEGLGRAALSGEVSGVSTQ